MRRAAATALLCLGAALLLAGSAQGARSLSRARWGAQGAGGGGGALSGGGV